MCSYAGVVSAQTLTLDSSIHYAIERNKRIKEGHLKLHESEQVQKNAFTNFFPKISAQAVAIRSNTYLIKGEIPETNLPVYNGNPETLQNPTQFAYLPATGIGVLDYANAGMVAAIQPIYAGGRIRSGYQLASLGTEVSEQQLNLTTQEVVAKTEEYYWTLVSLEAKRKTLASYDALLQSLLKDTQVAYDAGLAQKSDLLKVQLRLNEIRANKLKLENGLTLATMALCQHIGIEYSESITLTDTTFTTVAPTMLHAPPDSAVVQRDEYALLNKAIKAELLQKQLVRGEYLPQLAVGAQGLYLDMLDQQNTYGLAFATLSIPITDWWGGAHKLREHDMKIAIARNNLEEKSELLRLQIEKAYNELIENHEQIQVAASSVEQTQEHLKVVRDNFQAGIMSTSDMLEAQAMHQEARDALVDAKSMYQIRQVSYRKAIGQLEY